MCAFVPEVTYGWRIAEELILTTYFGHGQHACVRTTGLALNSSMIHSFQINFESLIQEKSTWNYYNNRNQKNKAK